MRMVLAGDLEMIHTPMPFESPVDHDRKGILLLLQAQDLNNHLSDAVSTQCLATNEALPSNTSERVEAGCYQKEYGSCNQTRRPSDDRKPLDDAHDKIDTCAHVVRLESANECIKSW